MANEREYKSNVFGMLMKEKRYAMEVYNALSGAHIEDPDLIEMCTLEDSISLTVRDDVAFIIDSNLHLYEHQSTVNANMPLRLLFYVTDIYKKSVQNSNLFGSRLIRIPTPKFVVFYNGESSRPEKEILKLSSAFINETDNPALELECIVYNINTDKKCQILEDCQVLKDYMKLVDKVRQLKKDNDVEPVKHAIECCMKNGILEEFLRNNRWEVEKYMTIDMTYEARERIMLREIGEERERADLEAERADSAEKFVTDTILKIMTTNQITFEEACDFMEIPADSRLYYKKKMED